MTDPINRPLAEQLTRRSLLKGGAGLMSAGGIAALLAACQTSGSTNPATASAGLMGNGEKYPVVIFLTTLSYWDMHFKGFADIGKALNVSFDKLGPTTADVRCRQYLPALPRAFHATRMLLSVKHFCI